MNRQPNFNRLARCYRWMEQVTFGKALGRCRCAFLDDTLDSGAALALGDGDGRFTARLLDANPTIRVDAVDLSDAMLRQLLHNAGTPRDRVQTHCADLRAWRPERSDYDLIVTHFVLDCLTTAEVAALAQRLHACSAPEAKWLISEFSAPDGWFGALIARPLIFGLYLGFRILTGLRVARLPEHRAALRQAGFVLREEKAHLRGLLVSELWRRSV
jgi:cyclopropane fatty-acyl-phospholipid synthase-like methyltransferase